MRKGQKRPRSLDTDRHDLRIRHIPADLWATYQARLLADLKRLPGLEANDVLLDLLRQFSDCSTWFGRQQGDRNPLDSIRRQLDATVLGRNPSDEAVAADIVRRRALGAYPPDSAGFPTIRK